MERNVTVKKWYVVTGTAGDTVTSPDGSKIFCTVPEGGQGIFYATAPKVVTSDDSVEVVETNFNSAPVKQKLLGLLGGGVSTLPSGYLQAEFLEAQRGWPNACIDLNKYQEPYQAATIGFRAGVTFKTKNYSKCWDFRGSSYSIRNCDMNNQNVLYAEYFNKKIPLAPFSLGQKIESSLNFKNSKEAWAKIGGEEYNVSLQGANAIDDSTGASSFTACGESGVVTYFFEISQGDKVTRKMVPVVDAAGVPCLYDIVKGDTFYNNTGNDKYIIGMTLEQARKLSKLPKTGGTLTVSLPWEALDDARVQDALAKAAENGWTIIEQYRNPDATTENIAVDYLKLVDSCYVDPLYVPSRDGIIRYAGTIESIRSTENQPFFCNGWPRFAFQYNKTHGGLIANGADSLKSPFKCQTNLKYALEWFDSVSPVGYINGQQMLANNMTSPVPKDGFWIGCAYKNTNEYSNARHYYLSIEYDNEKAIDLVPVLSEVGEAGFYCNERKAFYGVQGSGSFAVGFETVEAARRLAKLPKVDAGELTVSLPAEARDAASMVPTALSIAASRGWTIIEQYRED